MDSPLLVVGEIVFFLLFFSSFFQKFSLLRIWFWRVGTSIRREVLAVESEYMLWRMGTGGGRVGTGCRGWLPAVDSGYRLWRAGTGSGGQVLAPEGGYWLWMVDTYVEGWYWQ